MIKIENLHKYFENKKVLNGVNLDIEEGTSSVIIGGSGTGKSVLIKCILGLLTPEKGRISIKNNIIFENNDLVTPFDGINDSIICDTVMPTFIPFVLR